MENCVLGHNSSIPEFKHAPCQRGNDGMSSGGLAPDRPQKQATVLSNIFATKLISTKQQVLMLQPETPGPLF
jgi:hypothetical protein